MVSQCSIYGSRANWPASTDMPCPSAEKDLQMRVSDVMKGLRKIGETEGCSGSFSSDVLPRNIEGVMEVKG